MHRGVEQRLARMAHNHQVAGSIPAPATKKNISALKDWGFFLRCAYGAQTCVFVFDKVAGSASLCFASLFVRKICKHIFRLFTPPIPTYITKKNTTVKN